MITIEEERLRNELLGISGVPQDIWYFHSVPASIMYELVSVGMADPGERQNESPTLLVMTRYCHHVGDRATLHGYTLPRERTDCRISVEGVEVEGPMTTDEILEFVEMFRDADDFQVGPTGAYCWYD